MIEVDIERRLGAFQLSVQFAVNQQTLVLFGPSGSGKSQTLSAIVGLSRPDRGRIVIDDEVLFDSDHSINIPPEARHIGYVPQGYALFPHLTVAENVAFGLRGLSTSEARHRTAEVVALLRLEGLEKHRPAHISGGQQQRVALARALVVRPRVLLLDEPFAALDSEIRRRLRSELVDLQRSVGITVLFVTHDLAEAHAIGSSVAIFDRGTILQTGQLTDAFDRPNSRRVAELTAVRNILPGTVIARSGDSLNVRVGTANLTAPDQPFAIGTAVDVCIRPEQILLVRSGREPHFGPRTNTMDGEIVREVAQGAFHTLYVRLDQRLRDGDFDLEIDVPAHPYEVMDVAQQRRWQISLKQSALHVVPSSVAGPAGKPRQ